jgi:hypothetical protein
MGIGRYHAVHAPRAQAFSAAARRSQSVQFQKSLPFKRSRLSFDVPVDAPVLPVVRKRASRAGERHDLAAEKQGLELRQDEFPVVLEKQRVTCPGSNAETAFRTGPPTLFARRLRYREGHVTDLDRDGLPTDDQLVS